MPFALADRSLPDALHTDAREAFLPCPPPRGYRNLGWRAEAPEALRWAGCGGRARTERMLAAIAPALPAPRIDPALAGFARFVERDLLCAPDDPAYPPVATPWTPAHRRRLMLDALYGDGPERNPERYDDAQGALPGLRLRGGAMALAPTTGDRAGDPFGAPNEEARDAATAAPAAAAFAALHAVALARFGAIADPRARFAAAQRVTRAVYRDIVFSELAPATLRSDVLGLCERAPLADPAAAGADDAPSEVSHAALPLWSAAAGGVADADGDATVVASPEALLTAMRYGVEGGILGLEALAALTAPQLRALPGASGWLATDAAARVRLLADWAAGGPLAERPRLRADPPLLAFLALESAAPAALGGGDGRRLGALGSALVGEALHASRRAGAPAVEDAPGLSREIAAVFPLGPPPRNLAALIVALRRFA